jgi:hypothetical protein
MGIVTRSGVRRAQSRTTADSLGFGAVLLSGGLEFALVPCPNGKGPASPAVETIGGADIAGPQPKCGAVGWVSGSRGRGRVVSFAPRGIRLGDAVEAVQGGCSTLAYWQITSAATPARQAASGERCRSTLPSSSAPRSGCKTCRLAEAQFRMAHKPSPPRLCHRLGPRDMPLEAKRVRHVAVTIPQPLVRRGAAARPR